MREIERIAINLEKEVDRLAAENAKLGEENKALKKRVDDCEQDYIDACNACFKFEATEVALRAEIKRLRQRSIEVQDIEADLAGANAELYYLRSMPEEIKRLSEGIRAIYARQQRDDGPGLHHLALESLDIGGMLRTLIESFEVSPAPVTETKPLVCHEMTEEETEEAAEIIRRAWEGVPEYPCKMCLRVPSQVMGFCKMCDAEVFPAIDGGMSANGGESQALQVAVLALHTLAGEFPTPTFETREDYLQATISEINEILGKK